MADKRLERRDKLRHRLVLAGEKRISLAGLHGLRARDLAEDADCALGALYTAFENLDDLILEVNRGTLQRIDHAMTAAVLEKEGARRQLHALGKAYVIFAKREPKLWRALFMHQLPESRNWPQWYAEQLERLMAKIAEPLQILRGDLSRPEAMIRARIIFAAVHGLVSISLDKRFVGLPEENLDQELASFIDGLIDASDRGK